jgi:hypothetical protein
MRRALIIGLSLLIMLTVGLVVLLASVGPGGGNAADASSCGAGAMPVSKIPDLDARQTRNAQTIIQVGKTLSVPTFGLEVAIATSYQEAKLRNIASSAVPESEGYPNDGVVSGDHDSVGTFQQRANWGTVAERMTVTIAADKFYRALLAVPGLGQAAADRGRPAGAGFGVPGRLRPVGGARALGRRQAGRDRGAGAVQRGADLNGDRQGQDRP